MARNRRDRVSAYLESQGCIRDYSRPLSTRYIKYRHVSGVGVYYHLGKAGACFVGPTPALSSAVSVTQIIWRQVVLWEESHAQPAQ